MVYCYKKIELKYTLITSITSVISVINTKHI